MLKFTKIVRFKSLIDVRYLYVLILLAIASPSKGVDVSIQYRDLSLNANLELAEGKSMKDGVVLLLHGMMAHNRMEIIEASQQALLDNNHSSLAITLSLGIDKRRGFYDCARPHTHTADGAVEELAAWVRWLSEQGVNKIVLMAHSRGANQAMVYTVERDDPAISHIVLLAPNTTSGAKMQYESRYGEGFDENLARVKNLLDLGKGDEMIEEINFYFCPKATVRADTFYSYNRDDDKFRQFNNYLPRMPKPTLIIVGSDDELHPNIQRNVAPFIDGERVRLTVIENADHFFRDFNIEEAVENAVSFINGID